jgi:hypothetical protein
MPFSTSVVSMAGVSRRTWPRASMLPLWRGCAHREARRLARRPDEITHEQPRVRDLETHRRVHAAADDRAPLFSNTARRSVSWSGSGEPAARGWLRAARPPPGAAARRPGVARRSSGAPRERRASGGGGAQRLHHRHRPEIRSISAQGFWTCRRSMDRRRPRIVDPGELDARSADASD